MNSEFVLGYCTFPDTMTAERVCTQLISEGLIACANIHAPHQAIFPWQGSIQKAPEVATWIKTSAAKKTSLKLRFQELHPYDVPCLVFLKIDDGLNEYLQWVKGLTF